MEALSGERIIKKHDLLDLILNLGQCVSRGGNAIPLPAPLPEPGSVMILEASIQKSRR
jgi:hypothetical protein